MVDDLYDDLFAYITVFFCKKNILRIDLVQLRKKTMGILQNIFLLYIYIQMKRKTREKNKKKCKRPDRIRTANLLITRRLLTILGQTNKLGFSESYIKWCL